MTQEAFGTGLRRRSGQPPIFEVLSLIPELSAFDKLSSKTDQLSAASGDRGEAGERFVENPDDPLLFAEFFRERDWPRT